MFIKQNGIPNLAQTYPQTVTDAKEGMEKTEAGAISFRCVHGFACADKIVLAVICGCKMAERCLYST